MLVFINNTILFTIFLLLLCLMLLIVICTYLSLYNVLIWFPKRAEVISRVVPLFFIYFFLAAWDRAPCWTESACTLQPFMLSFPPCGFCSSEASNKFDFFFFFFKQGPSNALYYFSLSLLEASFPHCTVFALLRTPCTKTPTELPQNKKRKEKNIGFNWSQGVLKNPPYINLPVRYLK